MNRKIAITVIAALGLSVMASYNCFSAVKKAAPKKTGKEVKAVKAETKTAKALVVFYSRTGNTKKVAEEIAAVLKCDIEEIIDTKDRSGISGYVGGGRDAMKKNLTEIKKIKNDPAMYETVIIGTPVWGAKMTPAVRTYISQNKTKLKKVAFFSTMGGRGDKQTFADMEEASGVKPLAVLTVLEKEVKGSQFKEKTDKFAQQLLH
jgi:flavodoxin